MKTHPHTDFQEEKNIYMAKQKAILKNSPANIVHVCIMPKYFCCMSHLFVD